MSLQIITDSACDLPEQIVKEYGIEALPFLVYLAGEEYADGVDITADKVYAAIRADQVPTTGPVSYTHLDVYKRQISTS